MTPEAPVNAVKNAQVASETIARPAGIQPSRAPVNRTRRRGAPLSPSAREMLGIVEQRLLDIGRELAKAPPRRLPG